MSEPKLTEAERETLRAELAKWSRAPGRIEEMLQRSVGPAVEAILAARQNAEQERDEARGNRDRLAHELAALRRQVADLTAERDGARAHAAAEAHEYEVMVVQRNEQYDRAEAAERALAARDLCSCGHEPHLHDVEAVPSLCLICGHEDDCGLTAADAVSWRAKERALREFHREAIAEAAEEVAARDGVIARVRALADEWTSGRVRAPWVGNVGLALRAALDRPAPQPDTATPYPAGHGWTPGKFSGGCRVLLARRPCDYSQEQHDPDLPPEDVDFSGRRRSTPPTANTEETPS